MLATGLLGIGALGASGDAPPVPQLPMPLAVYAMTPNSGGSAGSTPVIIFGSGFNGATSVKFGDTPARDFFPLGGRRIFAHTPAHAGGTLDVTVTTGLGTSAITNADHFTYQPIGTVVDAVDPRQGTAAGGTPITIVGHGLWGASSVQVGSVTIPCFFPPAGASGPTSAAQSQPLQVQRLAAESRLQRPMGGGGGGSPGAGRCQPFGDDSHLNILSPAFTGAVPSPVDITVTNGGVTSQTGPGSKFTYIAPIAPVINAIGPGHGTANGGTPVTIFGSGFSGLTRVNFGGPVPACAGGPPPGPCVQPSGDDTMLFMQTPPGPVGTVDVSVVTPAGFSPTPTPAAKFTYDTPGPPELDGVSPNHGSALGGTNVSLHGSGFTGATAVTFAGMPSIPACPPSTPQPCFTVGGDNTIGLNAPALAQGTAAPHMVDVTVTVGNGATSQTSATGPATKYTYDVPTAPFLGAIDPSHELPTIANNVRLMGFGLSTVTSVNFGGVAFGTCPPPQSGPCFDHQSDTGLLLRGIPVPNPLPNRPTPVQVFVHNPAGDSNQLTFTDDPEPAAAINGISPAHGPWTGGTTVYLSGQGFSGNRITHVTFAKAGRTAVNAPFWNTYQTDTVLQVVTPRVAAADTGTWTIQISSDLAVLAQTQFTYDAVPAQSPVVTELTPASGPQGTLVDIYGSGFATATDVTFGTTSVRSSAYIVNDNLIQVPSPAQGAAQTVDVRVTTSAGPSSITNADKYTYGAAVAGPYVGGLDAPSGSKYGGMNVTVFGAGFNDVNHSVASVQFGSTLYPCDGGGPHPCFQVIDDNHLLVTTAPQPQNAPSMVDVQVQLQGGAASPVNQPADQYTFTAPVRPEVDALSTITGSTEGGDSMMIFGSGFSGAQSVNFGAVAMPACPGPFASIARAARPASILGAGGGGSGCFNRGLDQVIFVQSIPPNAAGTIDVTVTGPTALVSNTNPPSDQYIYTPQGPPNVSLVSPAFGNSSGGVAVWVSGINLQGGFVSFGPNNPAFQQFPVSQNVILAMAPPGNVGRVDVFVTTPVATSQPNNDDGFTYQPSPAPAVTAVSPGSGSSEGGDEVLLTGTDLDGIMSINFGQGMQFNFFNEFDPWSLSANTVQTFSPPGPANTTVPVSVNAPYGTSGPNPNAAFQYNAFGQPMVNAISPGTGVSEGGDTVLISGVNLGNFSQVDFGATPSFGFSLAPGVLGTNSTPASTGTVDVVVKAPGGTSGTSANTKFTYVVTPRPVIAAISPIHGPPGTLVLISGTNLELNKKGDVVMFGTTRCFFCFQDTPGVIQAIAPPAAPTVTPPGPPDITITNDGGTSATSSADLFTTDVDQAPVANVIAPDSAAPGTQLFITGSHLGGTTQVTFGNDPAPFVVRSDSLVFAGAPCDNGATQVTVTTYAGSATTTNSFKFPRCTAPSGLSKAIKPPRPDNPPPVPPGPSGRRGGQGASGPIASFAGGGLMQVDDSAGSMIAATPSQDSVRIAIVELFTQMRRLSASLGGP